MTDPHDRQLEFKPWKIQSLYASGSNYHGNVILVGPNDDPSAIEVVAVDPHEYPQDVATAELVSLAPEMAEAILEFDEMLKSTLSLGEVMGHTGRLARLAEKLRSIQ